VCSHGSCWASLTFDQEEPSLKRGTYTRTWHMCVVQRVGWGQGMGHVCMYLFVCVEGKAVCECGRGRGGRGGRKDGSVLVTRAGNVCGACVLRGGGGGWTKHTPAVLHPLFNPPPPPPNRQTLIGLHSQ